MYKHDKNYCR